MSRENQGQHGAKEDLKAAGAKLKTVPFPEKMKFLGRLGLRPFGVKKPLYLGEYYPDEDFAQEIPEELQKKHEENRRKFALRLAEMSVGEGDENPAKNAGKTVTGSFEKRKNYTALVVDTLDKGGVEQVIWLLAKEFKQRGREIKVLCTVSGGEIADRIKTKAEVEVAIFGGNEEALRKYLTENPPLIANTHFLQTGMEVFYELGIPTVEVIHNMYVFLDKKMYFYEKLKNRYTDRYVAVSKCAKEVFLQRFQEVPQDKVTVIGNRFQRNVLLKKDRRQVRRELGINEDSFVFIFVGAIDVRKNCIGAVEAFAELTKRTDRDIRLIFAGSGNDSDYDRKVRKLVAKHELQKKVIFTGQRSDIFDLLNASDVFLMLSYYEGWSVAATESLIAGLPLIHSDCGSARELLGEGRNGILVQNPANPITGYSYEDLTEAMYDGLNQNKAEQVKAMLFMVENENEWKGKQCEIRQFAAQYFDNAKVAAEYEEVFEEVLAEVRSTAKL